MTQDKNKIQVIEIVNPVDPYAKNFSTVDYVPGKTLADLYPSILMREAFVFSINGKVVEEEAKALTYPQAGDVIVMCPVLAGSSGGEGGGKSILRIVAIIALAFFTGGAGGFAAGLSGAAVGSVGYSLAYAGIMIAGSMVINALLPPPKTKSAAGAASADETPTYGIDGPKNMSAEGISVPVVYGTHRYGGNLINAYTTNENNTQLLHLLYNCGEGPIASLTDILVNDIPITNYTDYQVEQRLGFPDGPGVPWFQQQISPRSIGQELTTGYIYKITETDVDQLRLDVSCPAGMYGAFTNKADNYMIYTPVLADVRKVGTQEWQPFSEGLMVIAANQKTAVRRSFYSRVLEQGKYEVRIRRDRVANGAEGTAPPDMQWVDSVVATDLNEILFEPVNYKHTALLAIRIRLTDQLNGLPTVTHLNGGKVIRCWDASTGQWVNKGSSNPAWITLDALTNKRYGAAQALSRFDLERWKEWAAHCDANGLQFNGVFDVQSNIWDAMQPVFRCGHAGRTNVGTRFSVAIERAETPRMMFSVANMIQGSFKQNWLSSADRANELEVTYIDRNDGYRQKVMRVVDTKVKSKTSKSSQVSFTGLTSVEEAWRDANILLNQNRLLLQTVEFSAPLEAIACSVGDVVLVQHDMPKWSLAGRLEEGSTLGKVMLDRPVQMDPNEIYSVLVHMSAVKRFAGTVSFLQGTAIFMSGYAGAPVKRCKVGGRDVEVTQIIQQGNSWGVILPNVDGISAGAAVELWDTDAIETRQVVNLAATAGQDFTELTLTTPLPVAPEVYTQWMFGKVNRTGKPFRIRSIRGTHDYQRDISALEYNADAYQSTPAPTPPNYSDLERFVKQAVIDGVSEEVFLIGPATRSRVTVHYSSADENYFMANVYLSRNGAPEVKVGEHANEITVEANLGDELVFRVVARDSFMRSAPRSTAPTIYHYVAGRTKLPNDATGLTARVDASGWEASWDPATDPDVTASELRIGPTWDTARVLWRGNATSCRFAFQAAGEHQLRLRHCIGQTDGLYSGEDCVKTITVLAPIQPIVTGEVESRNVSLVWQECTATQPLFGYKIQSGTTADNITDIGSSSTPTFQRIEPTAGKRRYWVTAVDVAGNVSAPGQIELESLPSIDEALDELHQGLDDVIADLGNTKTGLAQEVTDRTNALVAEATARGNAISAESTARTTAITKEVTDRNAAIAVETSARTAALTAEATARATAITTAINKEVTDRNTAIAGEATLRTDADQAEVTARTNALLAEAQNRNAAIASEATLRANADAAEVTARQNLATQLQNADQILTSAIQNEASIRSTADTSEVTQRESLGIVLTGRGDVTPALSRVLGPSMRLAFAAAAMSLGVWEVPSPTSGWIYDEQQARITADSVEVAARESLSAQLRGAYDGTDVAQLSSGLIFSERQARVAADAAEVTARQALQTTVTNNKTTTDAAITSEQTARSTADGALGARIDTVTATATTDRTNANTAISNEQTARATADTALGTRIDTLTTTVTNNQTTGNAAVVAEAAARATADTAEASRRETLATSIMGMPNPADQLGAVEGESLTLDFGGIAFKSYEKPTVDTLASGLIYDERTARITADSAEVTARQALAATVATNKGTAEAAMTAEQTARANADAAEVTAREALQSQMRGNYAGTDLAQVTTGLIAAEKTARTTADSAIVTSVTSLQTTVTNNKTTTDGAILAEQTARAAADSAEATQREALSVALTGAPSLANTLAGVTGPSLRLNLLTPFLGAWQPPALDVLSSGLLFDERQARLSADAAEVSARETLATQMRGNATGTDVDTVTSGLLYSERMARSTADSAEAAKRETLSAAVMGQANPALTLDTVEGESLNLDFGTATYNGWYKPAMDLLSSGLIFEERQARAAADSANASSILTLTSTLNSTTDGLPSKATSAAVSALTTRVTNAEGTITSTASSLSSLNTTVGGYSAAITNNSTAIATLSGQVKATWRLNVDANGKTSGIILDNNGTTSNLVMLVDKFAIATAGAGGTIKYPFVVGTVAGNTSIGIDGNLFVDGTVTTRTLAAEAVTAEKIKGKSITADQIAAGAISADLINVGVGRNLLKNSSWVDYNNYSVDNQQPIGWAFTPNVGGNFWRIIPTPANYADWIPSNLNGFDMHSNGGQPSAGDLSQYMLLQSFFTASPGKRYEASVYSGAHRCRVAVDIIWYNGTTQLTGTGSPSGAINDQELMGGTSLASYKRVGLFATAPANADRGLFRIIKYPIVVGSADNHAFLTCPMVAEATAFQTVFSSYSSTGSGTQITPAGISTPHLSAISANIGLLRTAGSGARTEIESNQVRVYDSNNVLRVRMGVW